MIRINLLDEEPELNTANLIWLFAYGASVVFIIGLFITIRFITSVSIEVLEDRIASQERQLLLLKGKTKEVSNLEKQRDELNTMVLIIAALRKSQQGPVKMLDDFNLALVDRMWINGISLDRPKMRVVGVAITDDQVVEFMRRLEESKYFERVDLKESFSIPLVQVTTFNTQTKKETRLIVRGEKKRVAEKITEIKREADSLGLIFSEGVPDSKDENAKSIVGTVDVEYKRPVALRPTLFAWESFEPVKGKLFSLEIKVRLVSKEISIEDLLPSNAIVDDPSTMNDKKLEDMSL